LLSEAIMSGPVPSVESARQLSLADAEQLFRLARTLFEQGFCDKALPMLNWIGHAFPDQPHVAHARGLCLKRQRKFDQAHQAFAQAWVLAPDNPTSAMQAAECAVMHGDAMAVDSLRAVIWRAESDPAWAACGKRAMLLLTRLQVRELAAQRKMGEVATC
jgi:Flp pilus assembly protein TadD